MIEKLSLVIVEDNELMLFGISSALSSFEELEIVATAGDGKKGLAIIEQFKPNVALIDIRMPKMNGIELTKAIREKNIKTSIVIITSIEDDEWLFKAFLAGANAYTLKDIQPNELFNTIKIVASGLTLIQPTVAKHVLNELQTVKKTKEENTQTESLTERELETLTLIAKGFKNKKIADSMSITEGTVKLHINNILRKLGVVDRTQALLKAIENDLL